MMDNGYCNETIRNYIEKYSEDLYEDIFKTDKRFSVFYHLSESRKAVLNWYDFKVDANLLEVGGAYGSLTGLFCEKCKQVTVTEKSQERVQALKVRLSKYENVAVMQGDILDLTKTEEISDRSFDYIVVMGLLELQEDPVLYLKHMKELLKPDGKLLLAVDNAYGAHFLAGGTHVNIKQVPFSSLDGIGRVHFTRESFLQTIKASGFSAYKLYYPLPDYHFPQVIYSDYYLPKTKLSERVRPYHNKGQSLVASEKRILDESVNNDAFPFVANSFLAECSLEEDSSCIDYAAVTMERNRENSCITKIYHNGVVKKESVWSRENRQMNRIFDNLLDLQSHGLETVSCKKTETGLEMAFCDKPLLSSLLEEMAKEGANKIYEIFDKLYQNILQSSKQMADEDNVLLTEENKELNWGPILEKCYFEMIPMNCFFDGINCIYFDQEFVKQNYPAKYTMYRALRNSYLFHPDIAKQVPLDCMKKRYELDDTWDIFEKEDNRFLEDIRKKDNPLWDNARNDWEIIERNRKKLQENP